MKRDVVRILLGAVIGLGAFVGFIIRLTSGVSSGHTPEADLVDCLRFYLPLMLLGVWLELIGVLSLRKQQLRAAAERSLAASRSF